MYCFVFVWFLGLLSDYEKQHCFPCKSSVFLESCWLGGSLLLALCFSYFCCFVVLFVSSLQNEGVLLYVCVVCFLFCNKTKWFSCLHLVVLFFFLFYFQFLFFLCFLVPVKKMVPKNLQSENFMDFCDFSFCSSFLSNWKHRRTPNANECCFATHSSLELLCCTL